MPVTILTVVALCGSVLIPNVQSAKNIVDLSHSLNSKTHRWPTNREFELTVIANGSLPGGGWLATNDVAFSEHTGTHLDAPAHFASRDGIYYASTIPVERLVGPVSLINLADKVESNRDYLVAAEDITDWEEAFGTIPEGAIVLFDFNWAQYWDSYSGVFGSDSTNTSTFHFPGVGMDAAKILADRQVYGVGIDTPSVDYGPSIDYATHIYLMDKNIYFLENVGDMSSLPAGGKGVTLIVGAMKIDGGTGGPVRLIAMFNDEVSLGHRLNVSPLFWFIILCGLTALS